MIIVKLIGGLGNQMFQYAAGKALALRHQVELKLDLSFLLERKDIKKVTKRDFELSCFQINEVFAERGECRYYIGQINVPLRLLRNLLLKAEVTYPVCFKEKGYHYNKEFEYLPPKTYLEGYWQTEKYFKDYTLELRECFQFKDMPVKLNAELMEKIRNTNSISMHIRRGDYITNPTTNHFHGVCSIDYYMNAVELILSKVKDPYFFVFSDDIPWVKENLGLKKFPIIYVSHNKDTKNYEDLRLMSNCKHNITANSSFSWWGAWLNLNSGKIVIVPCKWFNDPTINTIDLIPNDWIKM